MLIIYIFQVGNFDSGKVQHVQELLLYGKKTLVMNKSIDVNNKLEHKLQHVSSVYIDNTVSWI